VRYVLWSLFAIAAGAVLYFTLLPGPGGGPFTWWDKFQHFSAYAVLSLLACLAARSWREALLFAVLLAVAGYGLEIAQLYVGRSYDLADEVANALGCFAGFSVSRAVVALRKTA
jgi:VanZ family protein